jgi:5-methylcytosine-specific restriction endonuclease McrA
MDNLKEIVERSYSIAQVLKELGLKPIGGNYRILKRKLKEQDISTSHFTGMAHNKGKTWSRPKVPTAEILKEGSNFQTFKLKNRLLKEKLIENKCVDCGLTDTYNGKPLSLHLDHINGDNTDNRIENLRMLCPNCHSQTDTYAGKNKGK